MKVKMTGTVKWFNQEKGFGFINFNEDESVFFHIRAFIEKIEAERIIPGMEVLFELAKDNRIEKTKAIRIEVL